MLNRLFGSDNEPPDDVDEYALIRSSPNRTKIKSYDDPVEPQYVKLNEDLPPGTYQLQIVNNGQFGELIWKEQIGDDPANEALDRAARAEQKAQQAEREAQQRSEKQSTPRFEDPFDHLAYRVVSAAVTDEEIMSRHGDEILARALESAFTNGGPSVDYQIDSEFQMALHEIRSDPERASEYASLAGDLASAVGESFGEGVREGIASDSSAEAQNGKDGGGLETSLEGLDVPDPSTNGESKTPSNGIDGGPSTLNDLGSAETESKNNHTESNSDDEMSEQNDADGSEDAQGGETSSENPSPDEVAEVI
jgi:hypothetical protein